MPQRYIFSLYNENTGYGGYYLSPRYFVSWINIHEKKSNVYTLSLMSISEHYLDLEKNHIYMNIYSRC